MSYVCLGLLPFIFIEWKFNRGVLTLNHLYSDATLLPSSGLTFAFSLPNSYFFQYLQIRHILHLLSWPQKPCSPTPFGRFLLGSSGLSKGLSVLKSLLLGALLLVHSISNIKVGDWIIYSLLPWRLVLCLPPAFPWEFQSV